MQPDHHDLSDLASIHLFLRAFRPHKGYGSIYRGHASKDWPLIPKAGRAEFFLSNNRCIGRFNDWCKQAIAYMPNLPDNQWERMAIAQHYGLATCLLDWTTNPLVALYFACSELPHSDAAFYCHTPSNYIDPDVAKIGEFNLQGVAFVAKSFTTRILNQRGMFTAHLPANQPIVVAQDPSIPTILNLRVGLIPAKLKPEIVDMLDDYGINKVTLFPDLDGLSGKLNWETAKMVARRTSVT
jgi:hypothetical protein